MKELYNISEYSQPARLFTGAQIREAAQSGPELLLDLGRGEKTHCRLAATSRGWCTVVLDNGRIIQEWAYCFSC